MRSALIFLLLLAGCASTPPEVLTIEKPVMIQSPPVFLPVPAALFNGCTAPGPLGTTNGDLLLAYHAALDFAACLSSELTAIQGLK